MRPSQAKDLSVLLHKHNPRKIYMRHNSLDITHKGVCDDLYLLMEITCLLENGCLMDPLSLPLLGKTRTDDAS